jgi:hypothetical protein
LQERCKRSVLGSGDMQVQADIWVASQDCCKYPAGAVRATA